MFNLKKIHTPTLLLNEAQCHKNIAHMCKKAAAQRIDFRPHFKTHQSAEIGEWFKNNKITKCTVSSVKMAEYFAAHGWKDITIAFPFNPRTIDEINILGEKIHLNILISDVQSLPFLARIKTDIGIFVEIDTGYHRTGFIPQNKSGIETVIETCMHNPDLTFKGFLTHAGDTYHASGPTEILQIHHKNQTILSALHTYFSAQNPYISIGDTPSCTIAENFSGIDEIRPGNFVFYDIMQQELGVCNYTDIAVALACPIVTVDAQQEKIVVHGGAIHLSKEQSNGRSISHYGRIAFLAPNGWSAPIENAYVDSLSQEHGSIHIPASYAKQFSPGDLLAILPVHSCLTANLMHIYTTNNGSTFSQFSYDL